MQAAPAICVLCRMPVRGTIRKHLGGHLVELAAFALPWDLRYVVDDTEAEPYKNFENPFDDGPGSDGGKSKNHGEESDAPL